MSSGREFQRTDAATGNERRPMVERRNDGTRSEWVDDDRSHFLNGLLLRDREMVRPNIPHDTVWIILKSF